MFDITSSKFLILGIVALLVIGPKDLPAVLRTIGKYVGIIKKHAAEFRAQFDDAMRETELDQIRKDVEKIGQEAEASVRAAETSVSSEFTEAQASVDAALQEGTGTPPTARPIDTDASGTAAPAGETATASTDGASAGETKPADAKAGA